MPFTTNRGQRIHYTVEGSGALVVLQHGILMDAASWKQAGFVDALSDAFRVACVDSLGHGLSDKPSDPALYGSEQRAADITAVLDDLGYERAHLVGHSMGGWLAVGVARHDPERLSSLVVGGWDPVNGLPPTPKGPVSFEAFMKFAARAAPALVEWVTPAFEPGVRACFEALGQLQGAREAVLSTEFPVMIWEGRDDPNHDARKNFATAHGLRFLSTAGDHLGMLLRHRAESARGIRAFLDGADRGCPAASTRGGESLTPASIRCR
jgi:pimeloyl-ACP methyl ester carboxylesterase